MLIPRRPSENAVFDKSMPSQRILLLILLPPLVIGLLLGMHFLWSQSTQRQANLHEHGRLLGEQLAYVSASALRERDRDYLQRLSTEALEHSQLRSLQLLDNRGNRLAAAGPRAQSPEPTLDAQRTSFSGTSEQSRFRFPVYSSHLLTEDPPADGQRKLLGWVDLELSHQSNLLGLYRDLLVLSVLCLAGLSLLIPFVHRLFDTLRSPLGNLASGLSNLRDGQLQTRLPADSGNPELDAIARDFNHLAEQLRQVTEELQNGADQATADLHLSMETLERHNIEMGLELNALRKSASEGSRSQSAFLANMGHEIRTPLNAVLGFIRLLYQTQLDNHQRNCVTHIDEAAHNLLTLVNNILDLSKMEAGKLKLMRNPLNLRDLIDDTLAMYAPQAQERNLELVSLYYQDTPHCVLGDSQRLQQILGNLVSNAIKFTNQGEVVVRTQVEDMTSDQVFLRISVQDTGSGISPEEQQQLFRPFSQLDNSTTRRNSGSGLGLAICRNLVEQMEGQIGVNSERGTGTEFWLTLKLSLSHEQNSPPPALLAGQRVGIAAQCEPLRYQLRGLLEECRMPSTLASSVDELLELADEAHKLGQPLQMALIDTGFSPPGPALESAIEHLRAQDCQILLLCPANQVRQLEASLASDNDRVLNRPVSANRLTITLGQMLSHTPSPPADEEEEAHPLLARRPAILCVDDNPPNLLLLRTLLDDMGARVTAVESGQAAVDACLQQCFDLVFMDVQMPGMDGRQATETIRRNELGRSSCPPVPIVALTAHALEDERRALLQCGMDDYLNKPATPPQLLQMIRKWVNLDSSDCQMAAEDCPPESSGLFDPQESLMLAAGNHKLATELLRMLLDSLPAERESVNAARQAHDHSMLIDRVHRIHGATRYCGVPQLRQACQQAETLLKQKQPADEALDALDAAIVTLLELAPEMPEAGARP